MKPKQFCCDATKDQYMSYYSEQSQTGGGMPVFRGSRSQRGHGIGSVLGGLFRSALPFLKSGVQALGKHVLKTGMNIANDVVEGHGFEDSFKNRVLPQGIKQAGRDALRGGLDMAQDMLRDHLNPKQSVTDNASNPWINSHASNPWNDQRSTDPWGNPRASDPWSNHQASNSWGNAQPSNPWGNTRTADPWSNSGSSIGLNGNSWTNFPPQSQPRRNTDSNAFKGNPWVNFNQSGSGKRRRHISSKKKVKKVKKDIFE